MVVAAELRSTDWPRGAENVHARHLSTAPLGFCQRVLDIFVAPFDECYRLVNIL